MTGRRYSSLTQVNQTTVKNLTLAWTSAADRRVRRRGRRFRPRRRRWRRTDHHRRGRDRGLRRRRAPSIKGAILQVDGILYVTAPDNVWALDARDGRELWRYFWKTKGGTHIGNRGAAMWRNYLFFETPDNYLVSLDARTGKERWHVEIADFNQQYFSTMAPIVIGDHVLVGTGNDLDAPGFLQSYDPETGKRKWIFYTVPMKAGDPGPRHLAEPRRGAARRRAGVDPRRLRSGDQALYLRHRQSHARLHRRRPQGRQPLHLLAGRGERRYRQDGVVLPDLAARHARLGLGADADPDRRRRSTASRASWCPRRRATATSSPSTASPASTSSPPSTARRPTGRRTFGQDGSPEPNPEKEATIPGSLVSPVEGGVVELAAAGLLAGHRAVLHAGEQRVPDALPDRSRSARVDGPRRQAGGQCRVGRQRARAAIDYKTGKKVWRHAWPPGGGGGAGMLTSAGKVLFTGDGSGNFVAFDAANGKPLWHSRIGNISNAPQTYMLDGKQHVLVAVGDTLYSFTLY